MGKTKYSRQYKDSVFVDLFSRDQSAKENFISLYNALHGTNLETSTTEISLIRLEQVMYMNFYNDVSCLVDNKIIVLAEHQSTINENMPLRFLEYIARLYEQIQIPKDRYLRKLAKIPLPEFYVFYNGQEEYPTVKTLKLSDAFLQESKESALELTVQVLNINLDKKNEVLNKCKPLAQYSEFVQIVRKHLEQDRENGFENAIKECLKNNILTEYLHRKSREVMNMLLAEYDYATDIEVQREEAWGQGKEIGIEQGIERGIEQGIERGIERGIEQGEYLARFSAARNAKQMGLSVEQIVILTGLSTFEVEQI